MSQDRSRHNRAAHREQDRVIAREAPFRFEQNKSTKLRPAIEGIDDTLVDQEIRRRRQRAIKAHALFRMKNLAVIPSQPDREHLRNKNCCQCRYGLKRLTLLIDIRQLPQVKRIIAHADT
jgi:hypothetical protein